ASILTSKLILGADSSVGGSGTLTISDVISGSGKALTKVGAGTLTLSGANTFSGALNIQEGTIVADNNSALGAVASGVSVSSGAILVLAGSRTIGAKALNLSGYGNSFTRGALHNNSDNNIYQGPITLAAPSWISSEAGTLTLDVATGNNAIEGPYNLTLGGAGNITINDPIATGTGTLTKDGNGTLNLSGDNTYSGATTVNGGTLLVNGSLAAGSAVEVGNGSTLNGTLGGKGTISGAVTVKSGSTIAPGTANGFEILHTGNLTFNPGSSMNWEYDSSDGDLVSAGTLSFPVSGEKVTIYVTKIGDVVNCERTLFTFTGTAPSDPSVAYLNFDLTGTSATKAEAYVDNTDSSVKVLLTPEPGMLALAALLLLALRKS
ncbi:MAG: autotransporter-associated beta strand repeat-containing protein, partial [bacterium]|nr:autotransporter-associated beta strand repeat-containing protein [bacterium]